MKKVTIELSPRQLNSLVYSFSFATFFQPQNREQKVIKSILEKLILKIKKKHLDVESKIHTLFTKVKKGKYTFEYYEAHCLEQYLLIIENNAFNDYDRNAILYIKNKLNQQLA